MSSRILTAVALSASVFAQAAHADCIRLGFENATGKTIRYLYVSPSTYRGCGRDVLGSDVLGTGDTEFVAACFDSDDDNYDFKAVYSDGSFDEWRNGVNISGSAFVWVDRRHVLHSR
jgi:hypothetical protein